MMGLVSLQEENQELAPSLHHVTQHTTRGQLSVNQEEISLQPLTMLAS